MATVRLNHGDGTFPDSDRSTYSFNFLLVTPAATWSSVAIADVNGDGRPDIVAANTTADLVSVLPGQFGGGFGFAQQSPLNTAGGSTLTALALADINADGKVDVAVTDSKNNQLRTMAGAGNGTFSGGGPFAVGTHPTAVALADFNHDSKLDAAVTNSSSGNVSIFIQSGGTYLPAVNDAAGAGARALAVADLDADGNPDLAVAGQTANSVAVLRGRSDGTFFAALGYTTGTNPVAVAATDLNGDTHPDLVTANSGSANVSVLLSVPAAVPGGPTITGATAGQAQATVTWTAPASDGGLPVTGYTVTSNPGNKTATVAGTATSATVGGLTNGTAYTFTVHATNAVGSGTESSPSAAVTPQQATVPGAPTGVVAARGDAQALITWTAPASDGGSPITGYTVTVTPGGTTVDATHGRRTGHLGPGRRAGQRYELHVHRPCHQRGRCRRRVGRQQRRSPRRRPGAPAVVTAQPVTGRRRSPGRLVQQRGQRHHRLHVTSTPGGKTSTVAGSATSATVTTSRTASVTASRSTPPTASATASSRPPRTRSPRRRRPLPGSRPPCPPAPARRRPPSTGRHRRATAGAPSPATP